MCFYGPLSIFSISDLKSSFDFRSNIGSTCGSLFRIDRIFAVSCVLFVWGLSKFRWPVSGSVLLIRLFLSGLVNISISADGAANELATGGIFNKNGIVEV